MDSCRRLKFQVCNYFQFRMLIDMMKLAILIALMLPSGCFSPNGRCAIKFRGNSLALIKLTDERIRLISNVLCYLFLKWKFILLSASSCLSDFVVQKFVNREDTRTQSFTKHDGILDCISFSIFNGRIHQFLITDI